METSDPELCGCNGTALTKILSGLTLLISLGTLLFVWFFHNNLQPHAYSGSSYIIFRDQDGRFMGSISDDYGKLKLTRLDEKAARRVEMTFGDASVAIRLYRNEIPVAQWSVSEDGEKFEQLPTR